jgi:ankyrin repeat protein
MRWKLIIKLMLLLLLFIFGVKIYKYIEADKLCRQIRGGKEIDTNFSNGTNAPLFVDDIATIIQSEGIKIPLVEACYYRNIQAVEVLLENGADPNFYIKGRMSPLEAALWYGEVGPIDERSFVIVKMLVEAGCDVNLHASDKSVIRHLASIICPTGDDPIREQILLYLLDNGVDKSSDEYEDIFHLIVRSGNAELVRILLDKYEFDINGIGHKGQTPLIIAVSYSEITATEEMIQLLLDYGANKEIQDETGKTALDYAVENQYDDLVAILTEYKVECGEIHRHGS